MQQLVLYVFHSVQAYYERYRGGGFEACVYKCNSHHNLTVSAALSKLCIQLTCARKEMLLRPCNVDQLDIEEWP